MTMMQVPTITPWWTDPAWQTIPWTCPRCSRRYPGTPAAGERCLTCGYFETD